MGVLGAQRLSGVLPNVWQSWRIADVLHTIFPHGKRDSDPVFQATKNNDLVWLDVAARSRHPCGRRLSTSDTLHPYPGLYSLNLTHSISEICGQHCLYPCLIDAVEIFEPAIASIRCPFAITPLGQGTGLTFSRLLIQRSTRLIFVCR